MNVRRSLVALTVLLLAGSTAAHATPRLPQRTPNHIVTVVSLGVSETSPAVVHGKAVGPDVPLAKISGSGGYMQADAGVGCGIDVQQPVPFVLDAGWGDVLYGEIVSGGGGFDNTVSFVLKATGGQGRYAGWSGWGTYNAVIDSGGCSNSFTGLWKINRV